MYLITGLGNPGLQYYNNRHNIGFFAIERIQKYYDFPELSFEKKRNASISKGEINNKKVILMKPLTYMNKSGGPLSLVANFFKVPLENILIIHDEIDLSTGTIKYKKGGGHAGHNGLRNIILNLGSRDFSRIRIGVDRPNKSDDVSNYVLSDFTAQQKITIDNNKDKIIEYITNFLQQ